MFKQTSKTIVNVYRTSVQNYSTVSLKKFSGKAEKVLGNDANSPVSHPHVVETLCKKIDCETKKCDNPCGLPNEHKVKGNLTHTPPSNKPSKFVSDTDANGIKKDQHYVPQTPKKKFTETERQNYGKDIKDLKKYDQFAKNNRGSFDE